jgi:hypothetical protein
MIYITKDEGGGDVLTMKCPGCGKTVFWVNKKYWSGHDMNGQQIAGKTSPICQALFSDFTETQGNDMAGVLQLTLEAINKI